MNTKAYFSDNPPAGVREIRTGKGDIPGYVVLEQGGIPVSVLILYAPYHCSPFREVTIFSDFVAIGYEDRFCLYDYVSGNTRLELEQDSYFGHLYIDRGELFVCSATGITAIDNTGSILWDSPELAVDGVIIHDFNNDILRISAEMDPPGGWVDKLVSRQDGMVI